MPAVRQKLKLAENKLTTLFYVLLRDKLTLRELDQMIAEVLKEDHAPDDYAPYYSSHIKGTIEDCRRKAQRFIEFGAG